MLLELALVALAVAIALFVPGHLALRALGMPGVWATLVAPLASLTLLALLGEALALVGVPATPALMAALLVALPLVALLLARGRVPALALPPIAPWVPVAYVALGLALGYNLFVSRIGSPDALFQAYDVTQHINLIQAMGDSGTLSSLSTSPYLSAADQAIDPLGNGGFYPAAWHALCALVVQATGSSVPLVINASMLVLCCVAFPLAILSLLAVLFGGSRKTLLCGALVCLAFVSFPWNLLSFGPVYANVAGFSLMPAAMALFVHLLGDGPSPSDRARTAALVVVLAVGLALCHPNAIFTCIVFLVPYCVSRICAACDARGMPRPARAGLSLAFVATCAAFWVVCYRLPLFSGTVSHVWPPYALAFQEVVNVLTLSYNMGFNYEVAAQLPLAALVVFGFVRALHLRESRWLTVSYVLVCAILFAGATRSDELKQLLAGFWYTDPMRLAAIAAISAVPLAALGLSWAYDLVVRLVRAYNAPSGGQARTRVIAGTMAALFLVVNFMPEFNLPGLHQVVEEGPGQEGAASEEGGDPAKTGGAEQGSSAPVRVSCSFHTPFGDFRSAIEETYAYHEPLDDGERAFLEEVARRIPEGSLVINDPMDGSFLAYGTEGMRVYYRNFVGYGGDNETQESILVRTALDEYAERADVRDAVDALGARYVIQLRGGEDQSSFINLRGDYDERLFSGISSIGTDTPGFTLLYQVNEMSLYEIGG